MYTTTIKDGMTIVNTAKHDLKNITEKNGKFSIRFFACGKYYKLGTYDTLDKAIAIRNEARKHRADGTFLEYHSNTFSMRKKR